MATSCAESLPGVSPGYIRKQHVHDLQALPVLQAKFAIKRALMRLQIQVPKSCKAEAIELLEKLGAEIETRDFSTSQVSRAWPASSLVKRQLCMLFKQRHILLSRVIACTCSTA